MIGTKVRIPQDLLQYSYDKNTDIMEVFIEKSRPSFSDELYSGVYVYIDRNSEEIIGVSIMDYTKRNKNYISKMLPFDINFKYADQIIKES